jgi:DNA-binding NarL/FixJ family response regulator
LQLLKEGVSGVFYINDPIDLIGKGTRFILKNELWFKRCITSNHALLNGYKNLKFSLATGASGLTSNLSRREMEVFSLLMGGAKNAEIADKLFISVHTVKSHVSHILKKQGFASRKRFLH